MEKIQLWFSNDQASYVLMNQLLGDDNEISAEMYGYHPGKWTSEWEKDVSRMKGMTPFQHSLLTILLDSCDFLTKMYLHIFAMFSPPLLARVVIIIANIYLLILLYQVPF